MRHLIISTMLRGAVIPAEPVDAENQARIDAVLRGEALAVSLERDPPLSRWQERALARKPMRRAYANWALRMRA